MKKLLTAIVLFVFVVLPMSVMAMQPVTDSELSTMTGQSGVSINLDANINLNLGTVAWGDKDGLGTAEANGAGWVGISGLNSDIRVRLRPDLINGAFGAGGLGAQGLGLLQASSAAYSLFVSNFATYYTVTAPDPLKAALALNPIANIEAILGDAASPTIGGYPAALAAWVAANPGVLVPAYANNVAIVPLTIDVATDAGAGHGVAGTTFVRIGLGSLELKVNALETNVGLGADPAVGLNQVLGSLYMKNLVVLVSGQSYVDIYNGRAAGQGVTLGMHAILDGISLSTLSWGDADGIVVNDATGGPVPPTSDIAKKAGYVGLENVTIASLGIYGPITIDVATDAGGAAPNKQAAHPTTFVRIGFAGLNIQMGALDATAVIGDAKDFSGAKDTFGTIYLSGLNITMGAGSLVDIYNLFGQSGVVIDFNLNIGTLAIATLSWGDADGVTGAAAAGFVGLKDLNIAGLNISGNTTIDVATVAVGNTSALPVGTTFVRIGFNNVNIAMTSMDATVGLGTAKDALSQELGSIYMSSLTTDINGRVDIYAPSTTSQGVVLALNATVSALNIGALSWGDSNGIGGATTAGFVGLKDLAIGTMNIAGKVSIDVATVQSDAAYVVSPFTLMYHGYTTHKMSPASGTFVHIGLGTGNPNSLFTAADTLTVSLASLSADVALDSAKTLAGAGLGGSGLLGSIYVGSTTVKVNGWVDIAAH